MHFNNGKTYENITPVHTIYGVQPKGVKMLSHHWQSMINYPISKETFNKTFKLVTNN